MDENEFFRQATLAICGNIDIDSALLSSLKFLRQKMPVDRILLQLYEDGLNAMRTVAMATSGKAKTSDLVTPLSSEAREGMRNFEKGYDQQKTNSAWLFRDDPHQHRWIQEMFHLHGFKATSLLVLPLKMRHKVVGGGGLLLVTESDKKFTQANADLLSLLREPFAIVMSNALKHREVEKLRDMLADDNRYLHQELRRLAGDEIIGGNFGLKNVTEKVSRVASLDSPVLLLGETGVGKDLVADDIHYSSPRREGPFISVNCGAIPETLIDSELFGHEKGAFTGAVSQKRGRFERANKGTIFLDEIAELPLPSQVKLLRVLQNKEIERVGGTETIALDIRIIAATNRDLEMMVEAGTFRNDLWFRLNVFPIEIPPLRERKIDMPALVQHFIGLKAKELKLPHIPVLAPNAIEPLMAYHWPGNVRELANVVERALILNQGGLLSFDGITTILDQQTSEPESQSSNATNLDEVVAVHIKKILALTKGKIYGPDGAAELLGMNPSTLRHRMKKYGIEYGRRKE
ncbi:MAG: sigma 54-interacting transcriptional regulator [Candidatus Bathyarchaeota archaeon]|nr:sigma 54-interacting transcriptional regulator [Candidatus Bathyarchaeota archaeon]